jgi:cell division protein FtsB
MTESDSLNTNSPGISSPDGSVLCISDIATHLGVGKSTVKLWFNKFSKAFPDSIIAGKNLFSRESIHFFQFIYDLSISGCSDDDILDNIMNFHASKKHQSQEPKEPPQTMNQPKPEETSSTQPDILGIVAKLFDSRFANTLESFAKTIIDQREKSLLIEEKRAEAELLKARAMESRAESERLKAEALNNLAAELGKSGIGAPSRPSNNENSLFRSIKNYPTPSFDDLDFMNAAAKHGVDLPELTEENLVFPSESATVPEQDHTPPVKTEEVKTEEIDDLSLLLDENSAENGDVSPGIDSDGIDDLSLLLDPEEASLLSGSGSESAPVNDIDDLSALLDPKDMPEEIDDLSALLDENTIENEIDDLSKLLDPSPETAPQESPEEYKTKILSRIINLKQKEGLSIEETTEKFNNEGVRTLSGKGKWTTKTIAGIYKYIDSVQK